MNQVNGVDFMPIHEGVIVPHDFPYLADKARMLEKLGDFTEFHFPAANCKATGKGQLSCHDGDKKKFGDTELQALEFFTGHVHESTLGLELDSTKVTLSIFSPGYVPVMDMTMIYGEQDCKFSGF